MSEHSAPTPTPTPAPAQQSTRVRSLLVDRIGELVTNRPELGDGLLGTRHRAALVIEDGVVAWVGDEASAPGADVRLDAEQGCVLPGFVDSHTHIVFAGDRCEEFTDRMAGEAYRAGGIASTVASTRAASDEELEATARRLAREALFGGTTTLETKSGYGLTVRDEERILRIARGVTEETTFLGAHVVPAELAGREEEYVALVTGPMLSRCGPLARWCDGRARDRLQPRDELHDEHGLRRCARSPRVQDDPA